eukprot:scaffold13011_cov129-Isochrysis_galbana.AAC.2
MLGLSPIEVGRRPLVELCGTIRAPPLFVPNILGLKALPKGVIFARRPKGDPQYFGVLARLEPIELAEGEGGGAAFLGPPLYAYVFVGVDFASGSFFIDFNPFEGDEKLFIGFGEDRVSASAITKKARGDSGHPWGTPHLIEKGLLRAPFALIRLVGSASGFESSRAHPRKYGPNSSASRAR